MITPGSGGFGDPAARDEEAIAADLAEGYVTPAGIKRDYGDDKKKARRCDASAGRMIFGS